MRCLLSRCLIVPTYATAMLQTTRLPQPFGDVRDSKADVRRRAARVQLCRILSGGARGLGGVRDRRVTATVPHVSGLISWRCSSRRRGVPRSSVFRARTRHGLPRAHVVRRANCHFRGTSIPDNRNFIIFSFHRLLSAAVPRASCACFVCSAYICTCLLPTSVGTCMLHSTTIGKMGLYTYKCCEGVSRNYSARKVRSGAETNNSGAFCRDSGRLVLSWNCFNSRNPYRAFE